MDGWSGYDGPLDERRDGNYCQTLYGLILCGGWPLSQVILEGEETLLNPKQGEVASTNV